MPEETIITLLQVVALALPAVGIYLQVLGKRYEPNPDDVVQRNHSHDMMDFNLAKAGILMIIVSGLIDILYLILINLPPIGTDLGWIVLRVLLLSSLLVIGLGLILFAGSVYYSFGRNIMIGQNPSIKRTLFVFFNQLKNIALSSRD